MLDNSADLISQMQTTLGKMEVALGAISEAITWTNKEGKVQWSNATFERLINRQRLEVLGANLFDLLPLEQQGQKLAWEAHPINRLLQEQFQGTDIYELRQANQRLFLEISSAYIQFKGQEINGVLVIRDITERKRIEELLAKSEAKFRSLIQNSSDLIVILETDGTIKYASPSHERILVYQPSELIGKNAFELIHPDDVSEFLNIFHKSRQDASKILYVEFRFKTQDGSWCFLESTTNNLLAEPAVEAMVLNTRDISERKRAESQLLHNACHDSLTRLPNRALFMERLGRALKQAKRQENYLFAVLFIDLDRFKVINDSLGHTLGDQLLIAIARQLETCLRPGDTVARLGGDEFTILLEDIKDVSNALLVAERIQTELKLPFALGKTEVFTTASIGIALSTPDYEQPEALLRDADIAMYRAKARGKARHEVFKLGMHTRAVALLQLETDLRLAIERQEFQLYYQPIVCLKTGSIQGFEALLRWQHPQKGLIYPAEFIAVAEETELIIPISQWVLQAACYQLRTWQLQFPSHSSLTMSVNISGKQFSQPDLVEQVSQTLEETNLDAQSLKLEITESLLMENTESAVATLCELKAKNIQLHMDDFGTGYSSLSYLHRFPIQLLKIDRSFISRMELDQEKLAIAQTIITLAHTLGMEITAEGVEDNGQLTKLRELGCQYAQGHFFSQPVHQAAATALLAMKPQWLQYWELQDFPIDAVDEWLKSPNNPATILSDCESICS